MKQILEGMNFLHKKWIIHRVKLYKHNKDIKPSNILMDKNGEIKIADFGLSRECGSPFRELSATITTLFYR